MIDITPLETYIFGMVGFASFVIAFASSLIMFKNHVPDFPFMLSGLISMVLATLTLIFVMFVVGALFITGLSKLAFIGFVVSLAVGAGIWWNMKVSQ
jgi:hypothetical protein